MRAGLIGLAVLLCGLPALADDWAQWRGPKRNGVSAEINLPTTWSATDGVAWKAPLPGGGTSSPIVVGDRVYVTAADGPKQDELLTICLDRDTGGERWRLRLWGSSPTLYHPTKSGMAVATPAADDEHVYAVFGTGDVFCVDRDGGLVWQRSLADEYGPFENRFAYSSSPLLDGERLLLQCDHYGDSYALAIETRTGRNIWKADRPGAWLSWSSPQLAVAPGGLRELILCGSERIDGLDPSTGKELWTLPGMAHECVPTPVIEDGIVYAVSGPNGQTFAVRAGGSGDVTETELVWSSPTGAPFVPSGIIAGKYYYLVTDQGIGTCLSTGNGEVMWRKRFGGAYTASPVAGDDKLYFANEEGETLVIEAGVTEFRELARNPLGEPLYASPAISQGRVFIRTAGHLVCIGGES